MLLSSSQSASTVGGFVMSARAVLGHLLYFLTDTRMRAADLSEGARRSMHVSKALVLELMFYMQGDCHRSGITVLFEALSCCRTCT